MHDDVDEQILGVLKNLSPEALACRVKEVNYLRKKYPDFFPSSQVSSGVKILNEDRVALDQAFAKLDQEGFKRLANE